MLGSGTILIEKDTLRPDFFQLDNDSYPNAWRSLHHPLSPHDLENELSVAGWTFFFMANAIRTTSFGFDRAKTIRTALRRLMAKATLQKCNCLEISSVATRSLFGIPGVSISAHPRHIQHGLVFSG